ncbi:DNA-directed RNA polymerase subunit beta' [Propionibacterium freudenreichii]|uniref:DNA-directed RNA polymerase subunit beta' n=1 Tax=Propionibacterium freudenreichii TaxID=1744 RepID=UPI0004A0AE8A|nr:DNA-directed RNA polymerase subunit beta' [Propionibacterium freudenreichii]AWY96290.1 DNA-directed RNA polymerase, beta' subunit [Propionibacterium freudenreichii]MDK9592750.1 DNA-directed RNA polymerase subunit beta' [Propionibacterium freudenreichii]MDK9662293.1 DNA-directed RNA polymerase subunit beta' [Propionibacterium freudenreichii]WFF33625.1 DNA-directed RNA polymerase subunit beta' [Propionibacterium freudenreichii]WFF35856.1 DNA-directed RNA polymerase subunit beta' [Propionibact
MLDVNTYDTLKIGLATADQIRGWSYGEVKKPETINYRTLKPERDGLFGEQIFGPTRDWECACGKYKRVRFKGIVCERCGVEVTRSNVRRERMGHIELAAPVTHIWYFKGVPSRLGYLLDIAPKDLEKVIYFAAYMITRVDEDARSRDLSSLEAKVATEHKHIEGRRDADVEKRMSKLEEDLAKLEEEGAKADAKRKVKDGGEKELKTIRDRAQRELDRLDAVWDRFKGLKVQDLEGDEVLYREMKNRFGKYFDGFMGAEAVKRRLETFDLAAEADSLRETILTGKGQRKTRALKRLKVVSAFLDTGNSPMGMVLDAVPVIPPDLRPMVQLDGGRFATSDLNDLYRRVINRNNRLKRLLDLGAPEIIVNNEKRMLQEAVDSLFDNGRRGRPVTGPGNRPLKSLSDMLKGKQGRFRQNLLGKRVDYSGRSVIVVGPQLKMHQCGLPKQMALELFKPFVMKRLDDLNYAPNIKSAKRMVDRQRPQVFDVLDEVIREHPVLLNRAPTLHRLGIQAFEPLLIEGKAIQLHPLVCAAFNADFDGDQMAVHLPLSAEAQAEARILMLSSNNILKPADGKPIALPSHEMIIGMYYLTQDLDGLTGEGRAFSSKAEAVMAYDLHQLDLRAKCKIRLSGVVPPVGLEDKLRADGSLLLDTTLGQVIFNEALPDNYPYVTSHVGKKQLSAIINDLAIRFPRPVVVATLDNLKDMGFRWGTQSGVTVSIGDVQTPPNKPEIMASYEKKAAKIDKLYDRGAVTEEERRGELVQIWNDATAELTDAMEKNFTKTNPIYMMVNSGARGNMTQMRQIAAMRGLVANPKGEIIERPIKSNFREGLTVLEYFISTHGGRKGQADTALRTADSGYLTRRLVDVSQDVIIREEDCGTERGLMKTIAEPGADGMLVPAKMLDTSVHGRILATDATDESGKVVIEAGTMLDSTVVGNAIRAGITSIKVRSVLTCEATTGACAKCYGLSLANGKMVEVGEAVGIQAAQSIGEPGTQLTMRTFHTGGVAGDDITQGLPRVVELFEARTPKGKAPIAEADGRVKIEETDRGRKLTIVRDDGGEDVEYALPRRARLEFEDSNRVRHSIADGVHVGVGEQLTGGTIDPQDVLRVRGLRKVQEHLVEEVQKVYASQGSPIHDKHIEIVIRQMLRRVTVIESGDTPMMPGELVDRKTYEAANRKAVEEGGRPAEGRPVLMGITKASLATESWLSAASFQETTKVLTDASIHGKSDHLVGLKENVILGKLIPVGTGLERYRDIRVEPTAEAKANSFQVNYDPFDYDFGSGSGAAVPLDDLDFGDLR